jgi:prepilin-type N-terminal cleavage/methylation domain-containing protein
MQQPHHGHGQQRARAFSLVESMVVVAILGVIAALAVPQLLPRVHMAQLDGATQGAADFLARARTEAMVSKRCVRVRVTLPGGAAAGTTLVAERDNSFDCEANTPAGPFIDGSASAFVQFDTFTAESKKILFSFAVADGGRFPAEPATNELRFRPSGRVFGKNEPAPPTPKLDDDDALLVVKHPLITGTSGFRKILVDSNGLICTFRRGVSPAGPNFACP